jgi:hypothetical protein
LAVRSRLQGKFEKMETPFNNSIVWLVENIIQIRQDGMMQSEIHEAFEDVITKALHMFANEIESAYKAGWEMADIEDELPYKECGGESYAFEYFKNKHL